MTTPLKLIFLPGAGGSPHFWRPVSEQLDHPAGRALLGWPGFGDVPPVAGVDSFDDLVALVLREVDQPCALIAQSMGGAIALRVALARPGLITHLVLAVTSGGMDMSDIPVADWRPAFLAANPNAPRWFLDHREDLSAQIASVSAPALLLWGDRDPISPPEVGMRLHRLLPRSSLHIVPGGGHDLAHQHALTVAPLMAAHLREASGV